MERNDYKNKYLKYKQKYTNVLENMYGGEPMLNSNLIDALSTQPKAIYIVDEETYNKVRTLLSLGVNDTFKTINRHTNCIDMLIGISNRNVLKIIPMAEIIGFENDKYPNHPWNGYQKGMQQIDGSNAPYKKDKFAFTKGNTLSQSYFGKDDKTGNYDKETAKIHLLNAKSYFESCCFTDPYVIKLGKNADGISFLNFVGKLYEEVPQEYRPTKSVKRLHPVEAAKQAHGL